MKCESFEQVWWFLHIYAHVCLELQVENQNRKSVTFKHTSEIKWVFPDSRQL